MRLQLRVLRKAKDQSTLIGRQTQVWRFMAHYSQLPFRLLSAKGLTDRKVRHMLTGLHRNDRAQLRLEILIACIPIVSFFIFKVLTRTNVAVFGIAWAFEI
jgi:hypothetical protein